MEREIIETRGDYRAVIIRDEYGREPDSDLQAAIIRFDSRGFGNYDIDIKTDSASAFEDAARRFVFDHGMTKGIQLFERYLRTCHGTRDFRQFTYSYMPDSAVYVAFDSAAMREAWGYDGDEGAKGDAEEWQAYIDGDVYGVGVEHRRGYSTVTTYDDGETEEHSGADWSETEDGFTWGYYGREYAESEAHSLLDSYAPKND
jgi:hypothetical protein